MGWVENKVVSCLSILTGITMQLANAFLANIIIYEATAGLVFRWDLLFKNVLFWGFFILQIAHLLFLSVVKSKNRTADEKVEQAISKGQISLVGQAVDCSRNGDFDKADKVLKLLRKLEKERK